MKISIAVSIQKTQPLVIFACENDKTPCGLPKQKALIDLAVSEGFKGKTASTAILHPKAGSLSKLVILAGLGNRKKATAEHLRRAMSAALKKLQALSQPSFSAYLPAVLENAQTESSALTEGAVLAAYRFDKYKSADKSSSRAKNLTLVTTPAGLADCKKGVRLGQILSESACYVRDLVNEPPSSLPPSKMVECAQEIADSGKSSGITITIFDREKIEEMKMGALLGVNRGSAEPPFLVHLHYKPAASQKCIALVGKGITFDSGGLSLKPAEAMETMKMDMAGAASILGVFKALPALKPNVEIHGVLALTENMPGGRAYKPGDILTAMNGKSIEVLNTDAEGRLILADASKLNADAIIDIATLTGACIIALGSNVAGAMGNSPELLTDIQSAGESAGEPFWPLPLVEDYKDGLKSPIADIKNISSVRKEAGSIIGGLFLQEFVNSKPWAHLDIAGPAWTDREFHYKPQGGTGFPVRTLIRYILNLG